MNENADVPSAGNEKSTSSKDAKTKVKGKATGKGKDKDNTVIKEKAADDEGEERHESRSSGIYDSWFLF